MNQLDEHYQHLLDKRVWWIDDASRRSKHGHVIGLDNGVAAIRLTTGRVVRVPAADLRDPRED